MVETFISEVFDDFKDVVQLCDTILILVNVDQFGNKLKLCVENSVGVGICEGHTTALYELEIGNVSLDEVAEAVREMLNQSD